MKIAKPTIYKNDSDINLANKIVVFAIITIFIVSSVSALNINSQDKIFPTPNNSRNSYWTVTINFNETDGKNEYIIFGEAHDASDGIDIYDAPNPPESPGLYIDAYFTTTFENPHNRLFREVKEYPDTYKIWNFTVLRKGSNTTVTITWNATEVNASEYDNITLCDGLGIHLVDMMNDNNYIYFCSTDSITYFQIIATTNTPPILTDQSPANGSIDIQRPPDELNVTVTDPDGDTMDAYIKWRNHDGEWVTLRSNTSVGDGLYNTTNLTGIDWIWGNTTYTWCVNVTDGVAWTNETYEYTTGGSRYDVSNNDLVNFQDAGLVWIHRTSEEPYDGLYDVNSDGQVNFQDAGLTWINRD